MSGTSVGVFFLVFFAALLGALIAYALLPDFCERAWLAVANAVTFGWHRRLERHSGRPTSTLCTHWQAVAVSESVTGDIVAWLCPDCDAQLAERPPLALPPLPPFVPNPRLTIRTGM